MIKINDETLKNLKCVNCEGYLTCSPVYLKTDGGSVCGRCPSPEAQEGTRNNPYEELATLVSFPCRFKDYGCSLNILFHQVKQHEEVCKYQPPLSCPMAPEACTWRGKAEELLPHCRAKHPEQELQNPALIQHDVEKNKMSSFFIYVFQLLFLVQTKICTATSKMYHSVKLVTKPQHESDISYELQIKNSAGLLYNRRAVAPAGNLKFEEKCAIVTNLTALLGVLKSFDNTTFKITINALCLKCNNNFNECFCATVKNLAAIISRINFNEFIQRNRENEFTSPVASGSSQQISVSEPVYPNIGPQCKNHHLGCRFSDRNGNKREKHQIYYCEFSSWCVICSEDTASLDDNFEIHVSRIHGNIIHPSGVLWRPRRIGRFPWYVVRSSVGTLWCFYNIDSDSKGLTFRVSSPLRTEELQNYECIVILTHHRTGHTVFQSSDHTDVRYDMRYDWDIRFDDIECIHQYDISVDVLYNAPSPDFDE